MKKQILLSIPKPCHENWDQMTPVQKGRFCGSCQKQVVDFSRMSDREIAVFFKKPSTGSVCGRFMQDQLERPMEIPKKRIPWLKYFFQFALPAFLFSMKATAQGKVKVKEVQTAKASSTCTLTMGTPAIQVKGDIDISRPTDPLKSKLEDTLTLPEIIVHSSPIVMMGGIRSYYSTCSKKEEDSSISKGEVTVFKSGEKIILSPNKKVDKIISPEGFNIYPNPVRSGSFLKLEFLKAGEDIYQMQLLTLAGQEILLNEFSLDGEQKLFEFQMPFVPVGSYFLSVTNKRSGKSYTGKLLVQ